MIPHDYPQSEILKKADRALALLPGNERLVSLAYAEGKYARSEELAQKGAAMIKDIAEALDRLHQLEYELEMRSQ